MEKKTLRSLIEEIAKERGISISEISREIGYRQTSSIFIAMQKDRIEPVFEDRLLETYGYKKTYVKR